MTLEATTTRMSDENIIAQFVERMHDEYTKAEVMQKAVAAKQNDDNSLDQTNTQIVAAWDGESPLNDAEFVRVSYRELGADGISFWTETPPTTPFFVIVFVASDERVFIKARVSNAEPDPPRGPTCYLVNTKFDGRVETEFMPS
jgi:hypothetical protein